MTKLTVDLALTRKRLKKGRQSVVHQYSETNVKHFLFNLLRIKGLYMFRALVAHPQEALHKRHLVYCVRVMSVCCYKNWGGTGVGSSTPTLVAAN
jgi:aspartate/tyrosine/aromatic aminotransferase